MAGSIRRGMGARGGVWLCKGRAGVSKQDLIEAFEGGDMGRVEFFELALDAGMSIEEIGIVLEAEEES